MLLQEPPRFWQALALPLALLPPAQLLELELALVLLPASALLLPSVLPPF